MGLSIDEVSTILKSPYFILKILWIKTSPLHPLTRGGDLRTFHLLRHLHQNHDVTFVGMTADPGQVEGAQRSDEYCSRSRWAHEPKASLKLARWKFLLGALANLFSRLPYAVARFRSASLRRLLVETLKRESFDIIVSDFLFPAASMPWEMKEGTQTPWVLFQHNVESMIWRRRAEGLTGVKGRYWKRQRDRMWRFESQLSARFDGVLAVSDEDSRIFRQEMKLSNVIGVVPTGVDLDYFQALPKAPFPTPTVLFMGSMDWYANVDAVLYFVSDIWPKVRERLPEATFLIVGRQPPSEILALHSTDMGVEVTGTVPDVRPYMRKAHVMVVPLRIGGGTRLKIYEAMAAELPVVSTTVGAEGLPVVHGKHLLIADDSASIANEVIRVLLSPDLAGSLSQNAFQEVVQFMSWKAAASVFESSCQGLLKEATL